MYRHRFMEFPPTAGNPAEPTAGEGCYCVWLSCHAFSLILILERASECIAALLPFLPLANIGVFGDNRRIYTDFCRTTKKRAPNLFSTSWALSYDAPLIVRGAIFYYDTTLLVTSFLYVGKSGVEACDTALSAGIIIGFKQQNTRCCKVRYLSRTAICWSDCITWLEPQRPLSTTLSTATEPIIYKYISANSATDLIAVYQSVLTG